MLVSLSDVFASGQSDCDQIKINLLDQFKNLYEEFNAEEERFSNGNFIFFLYFIQDVLLQPIRLIGRLFNKEWKPQINQFTPKVLVPPNPHPLAQFAVRKVDRSSKTPKVSK
jgi:hypothetical protein